MAILILAAGKGSRMAAEGPKALVPLGGRPMLSHVLAAASEATRGRLVVVGAPKQREVLADLTASAELVFQHLPRGTGDAVACARPALASQSGAMIVLYADCPLIRPATLRRMAAAALSPSQPGLVILTYQNDGAERDSGFIAADLRRVWGWLGQLKPNTEGEIHWPDIVAVAESEGAAVVRLSCPVQELLGANSPEDLRRLEDLYRCGW